MKLTRSYRSLAVTALVAAATFTSCAPSLPEDEVQWRRVELVSGADSPFEVYQRYVRGEDMPAAVVDHSYVLLVLPDGSEKTLHGSGYDMAVAYWATNKHVYADQLVMDVSTGTHRRWIIRFDSQGEVERCADLTGLYEYPDHIEFIRMTEDGSVVFLKEATVGQEELEVDANSCSPVDLYSLRRREEVELWRLSTIP